ncbi:hypothetical protein EJ110_NYTH22357 [Nymphaea thermarum]|nr:hypothetical protein EJ110_NYTH22357 [Nymphaea thermarum]
MEDYIGKFNRICDDLSAIGKSVDEEAQVYWMLQGLGERYKAFIASMIRPSTLSYERDDSLIQTNDAHEEKRGEIGTHAQFQEVSIDNMPLNEQPVPNQLDNPNQGEHQTATTENMEQNQVHRNEDSTMPVNEQSVHNQLENLEQYQANME